MIERILKKKTKKTILLYILLILVLTVILFIGLIFSFGTNAYVSKYAIADESLDSSLFGSMHLKCKFLQSTTLKDFIDLDLHVIKKI